MLELDRRFGGRVPMEMFLDAYVDDRQQRGFTMNVSETGLYLYTLVRAPLPSAGRVGLEFRLPGMIESIWASGELCHDAVDHQYYGRGIRFLAMARPHARMLHDFCTNLRRQRFHGPAVASA